MTLTAKLKDVCVKRQHKTILGPISYDLNPAGITIVLGPNGAGKTTFLKVLHGVERLSSGHMTWSVSDDEARASQAYVFQSPIMLRRTVRQNLAFPLQLVGMPKAQIAERVESWAQKIGLAQALEVSAPRLSGGEKQKLALARALIREPKVVFLDEPCANLDGRSTREIEALLIKANEAGTSIIMTTHHIGQAKRLAENVIFLLDGKIHDSDAAASFFTTSRTAEAGAFLAGDIVE
ncbi:ABC transporter ATP-binding protein [Loktanella sp. Alg231-35]|uniref:ABC transporter ATP-binding protein n=1 Tax=Loktanella sp. Alg231-35 TaxID=1922220 RepID=UPI000D54EF3B|nr:ATP-binding cassette domain-containing protein [Loktanella sp. Alg231-35]